MGDARASPLWACVLSLFACSASPGEPKAPARDAPAATASPPVWVSPLERSHPLVGRIWDVPRGRFVSEETLTQALARTPLVALGEQHDNADHHLLQARLLTAMIARGRAPGVVFEMLDHEEQSLVTRALSERPRDPDALATAVDWAHSGWPAWSLYRPVFAAAVGSELPIVAAGIGREAAMGLARAGWTAVSPELARTFDLREDLPVEIQDALRAEMRDAHCGLLPDSMLDRMVLVQRVRDAELARALAGLETREGGVLIAGNGHVRGDRGVPALLRARRSAALLAVGLLEVRAEWTRPSQYAAAFGVPELPFDTVWFTPRANDADHGAELRKG